MLPDADFDQIYAIMETSFPPTEHRPYAGQKSLLTDPHYRLLTTRDAEGKIVAFLAAWEFAELRFIEHIAVSDSARGGGTGSKLMQQYMAESDQLIILEVELPEDELTIRRIAFYQRLGFTLNDFEYEQPSFGIQFPAIPMKLMSYPTPLDEASFAMSKQVIYHEVYHQATRGQFR